MSERDKAIEDEALQAACREWINIYHSGKTEWPVIEQSAIFHGWNAALDYHAKQNAEAEKLAKLEAWTQKLNRVHWRDGAIENRGEHGFALFDCSGSIIEHYPTLLAAIYAYLEQAEGEETESLARALKERSMLDPDAPNAIVFTSDAASE